MAVPVALGKDLVHEIVGRVLDHLDFLEHDLLFALDIVGGKQRIRDEVRQDVDGQRQMLVEHLDVIAGVLLRGERVELPANGVHLLGDVLR